MNLLVTDVVIPSEVILASCLITGFLLKLLCQQMVSFNSFWGVHISSTRFLHSPSWYLQFFFTSTYFSYVHISCPTLLAFTLRVKSIKLISTVPEVVLKMTINLPQKLLTFFDLQTHRKSSSLLIFLPGLYCQQDVIYFIPLQTPGPQIRSKAWRYITRVFRPQWSQFVVHTGGHKETNHAPGIRDHPLTARL